MRYSIGGASWNSTYDARLDSNSGKVELVYDGIVRQRTAHKTCITVRLNGQKGKKLLAGKKAGIAKRRYRATLSGNKRHRRRGSKSV